MSGGYGTRLRALSRQNYPKQFLSLFNQKSLFQQTISRVSDDSIFNPAIIIIQKFKLKNISKKMILQGLTIYMVAKKIFNELLN